MEVELTETGEYLIFKFDPLEVVSFHRCLRNIDYTHLKDYDLDFLKNVLYELEYYTD